MNSLLKIKNIVTIKIHTKYKININLFTIWLNILEQGDVGSGHFYLKIYSNELGLTELF